MSVALLIGATLSALVSGALCGLIAWCGPVDPPRARGSHARPTPTSGGLGLLAGAAVGAAAADALMPPGARGEARAVAATIAMAGALGLLGALDDVVDLGAGAKLAIQAAVALVFAFAVGRVTALPLFGPLALPLWPWVGALGVALWIVVATNAVNFMDGANGVAAGALAVALGALGLGALAQGEPDVAAAAFAGAAANAGFLPWNLGGRLFQGDAGALFSGFLFAGLCIVAERGGLYLYFGPLVVLPFLTDVLLTLLWRARRGRSLLEAHRDHLYQLWLSLTGRPHGALAWRVAAVMGGYGAYALMVQQAPPGWRLTLFGCGLLACILGWAGLRAALERRTDPARAGDLEAS